MANAEHLEILKEGVKVWNKWREENKDIKPDLIGADLRNADLTRINLRDADLTRTNLIRTNLIGADLIRADLIDADLSNAVLGSAVLTSANLSSAILVDADLSSTILTRANLGGSDLGSANLRIADLIDANLDSANLSGADLSGADLVRANLTRANLTRANLSSADLSDTVLSNAEISFTVFGLTDLSTCKGLETVEVRYPCTIDFQSLRASKNIPKSFLLKIGLPELYIDYLPDFYHDDGIRLYPAFLSHSWENKKFAHKLYEALIAKGVNVFFDEKKMKPGDDIYKSISRGIDYYDKMILVCSEDSLKSWWVDRELDRVLKKERSLYKEEGEHIDLLIPITIDDHIYKWVGPKAEEIQRYVIGDFKAWQDDAAFDKALNELIHALNVDRPEIKPPSFLKRNK